MSKKVELKFVKPAAVKRYAKGAQGGARVSKTALPVLDAVARATADHLAHHSMCSQLAAAGSPKVGRTQRTNAKLRAQFVSAANSACGFNALSAIREVRR